MVTQEDLMGQLDPERDYGPRTYEQVLEEVRSGKLELLENPRGLPMIRDTESFTFVSGTGRQRITQPYESRILAGNSRQDFMKLAVKDFPRVYRALVTLAVEKENVRALKLWFDKFIPDAPDVVAEDRDELLQRVMGMLANPATAFETVEVDENGRVIG